MLWVKTQAKDEIASLRICIIDLCYRNTYFQESICVFMLELSRELPCGPHDLAARRTSPLKN
jgi:hypothetical protein